MQPKTAKLSLFAMVVLAIGVAIGVNFSTGFEPSSKAVPFRDFMRDVEAGKIDDVTIAGQEVSGIYRADKETFHTFAPAHYEGLANELDAKGILKTR